MDLDQLLTRVKTAAAALSARQLATLAGAFVLVVGLAIGSAYWINAPTYGVLFTDMDPETASSVVTKLKNDKVTYVLDDGGRTVRVPTSRVDDLRLELAGQGMPNSGRIGFEIFDRTAFGVTDFLEHVNYRRALEGELARTIASLGDVASARVHLAMPRESLFANQEQPAKASVVLKLRGQQAAAGIDRRVDYRPGLSERRRAAAGVGGRHRQLRTLAGARDLRHRRAGRRTADGAAAAD